MKRKTHPLLPISAKQTILLNSKREHQTSMARSASQVHDQVYNTGNLKPAISTQPRHKMSKSNKIGEFIAVDPLASFKSYNPEVPPGTEYLEKCLKFRVQLCNDSHTSGADFKHSDKLNSYKIYKLIEGKPGKGESMQKVDKRLLEKQKKDRARAQQVKMLKQQQASSQSGSAFAQRRSGSIDPRGGSGSGGNFNMRQHHRENKGPSSNKKGPGPPRNRNRNNNNNNELIFPDSPTSTSFYSEKTTTPKSTKANLLKQMSSFKEYRDQNSSPIFSAIPTRGKRQQRRSQSNPNQNNNNNRGNSSANSSKSNRSKQQNRPSSNPPNRRGHGNTGSSSGRSDGHRKHTNSGSNLQKMQDDGLVESYNVLTAQDGTPLPKVKKWHPFLIYKAEEQPMRLG